MFECIQICVTKKPLICLVVANGACVTNNELKSTWKQPDTGHPRPAQITDEATEALKHKTFKELHKSTCKDSNVKCPFEPFDLKRDHDNFEETAIGKTI